MCCLQGLRLTSAQTIDFNNWKAPDLATMPKQLPMQLPFKRAAAATYASPTPTPTPTPTYNPSPEPFTADASLALTLPKISMPKLPSLQWPNWPTAARGKHLCCNQPAGCCQLVSH